MFNRSSGLVKLAMAAALFGGGLAGSAVAADEEAAKALARQNNCFKCHAIDKEKDGPTWRSVAKKYREKGNGPARLLTHLTTGEKAKFPDGHEEDHKIIKGGKEEIANLIQFILSL